ncbi:hypothetical protein OSB04_021148 [Centaurea solstitialis]|uniref:Uncharacterized protein n=1 Tax=Centaurea solstitialis TaxID=347529 RepID=A0AA38T5R9_9ASTR|nr:hypothetical protein OSB04_021148 [Centaurea solstitialis]
MLQPRYTVDIKSKFKITDLLRLGYFLGLEVKQTKEGVLLLEQKYVVALPKQFGTMKCKAVATPMSVNEKLVTDGGTGMAIAKKRYKSLINNLGLLEAINNAISSTKVKYVAPTTTTYHVGWLKRLLADVNQNQLHDT